MSEERVSSWRWERGGDNLEDMCLQYQGEHVGWRRVGVRVTSSAFAVGD